MEKGINLYYEDGYYGNNIDIWTVNGKGMSREEFLKARYSESWSLVLLTWIRKVFTCKRYSQ